MKTKNASIMSNEYKIKIGDALFVVTLDNSFLEKKALSFDNEYTSSRFLHYHVSNELFFIPKTKLLVNTENNRLFFSNCILNICPFFNHYTLRLVGSFRLLFTMERKNDSHKYFDQFNSLICNNLKPYKINKYIINQLEYISLIPFSNDYVYSELITSSLRVILLEFLRINGEKRNNSINTRTENYLFQIELILSDKYNENLSLNYFANLLHLSTKQVSRIVKKNYKCSLNTLVMNRRLHIACSLLIETDLTIEKIIELVNFNSPNYFYVCFKNRYGVSPKEYRLQYK